MNRAIGDLNEGTRFHGIEFVAPMATRPCVCVRGSECTIMDMHVDQHDWYLYEKLQDD